jgi:hypothetical protein
METVCAFGGWLAGHSKAEVDRINRADGMNEKTILDICLEICSAAPPCPEIAKHTIVAR